MKIAVVIPALDEAERITAAIESARSGTSPTPSEHRSRPASEIVVVDGGSQDATCELAQAAGARVIHAQKGRAHQLQTGFEATEGDPVLFLHADTRLPRGWAEEIAVALRPPAVVGGAFRFGFDRPGAALDLVALGARIRVALFGLPYGDQALFARRAVLEQIGGVPQVPLMEDLDLVKALKGQGRLALLPQVAETSARRHQERGVLGTALRHTAAALAWGLGIDRGRIARFLGRVS